MTATINKPDAGNDTVAAGVPGSLSASNSTSDGSSVCSSKKANESLRKFRHDRHSLMNTIQLQNMKIQELEKQLALVKSQEALSKLQEMLVQDLRDLRITPQ